MYKRRLQAIVSQGIIHVEVINLKKMLFKSAGNTNSETTISNWIQETITLSSILTF